jgi:hypothetical protein
MPFNINEFKSTLNKYGGPARKNLYVVEIASAPAGNDGMSVRDLRFFCQVAQVPGLNFSVADYYPNGFGTRQSIPTAMVPDTFNAVFMLDSDHNVLRFFHQWMQSVINYNYADGAFSQVDNQLPYEVGYKSEFATQITIKHYSTDSQDVFYEYILADAFPTQISGVDVSWGDNDSYATVTVNFAYAHMFMNGVRRGTPTERYARGTGLLDLINRVGTSGQVIRQGTLPTSIQDAVNSFTRVRSGIQNFNTSVSQIKTGINDIRNIFR